MLRPSYSPVLMVLRMTAMAGAVPAVTVVPVDMAAMVPMIKESPYMLVTLSLFPLGKVATVSAM